MIRDKLSIATNIALSVLIKPNLYNDQFSKTVKRNKRTSRGQAQFFTGSRKLKLAQGATKTDV